MTKHSFVLYHHFPFMGSTVRGDHEYAYHTIETPQKVSSVTHSRTELSKRLGFSEIITLHQSHSSVVYRITEKNLQDFRDNPLIEGDGIWTTIDDIMLGVFTADCLPIFFWIDDAIGIVHAGRKGVYGGIHRIMLEQLEKAGYPTSEVHVLIGPHIRSCCYTVGQEIIAEVSDSFAHQKDGRWYLDLEAKVKKDLLQDGVIMIESIPLCTYCSDPYLWYSYRRGEKKHRHLHFIGKKRKKIRIFR